MQTKKYKLLCMGLTAICAMVTPTLVRAGQNICTGGQYTITFDGQPVAGIEPGTLNWGYTITASQSSLNSVKEAVMIVPRPVMPQDIVPASFFTYCTERDSSTKINRGNCNGFPLPIALTKQGNSLRAIVVTSDRVTPGLVSMNVISGQATSDVCVNLDDPEPKGIPGPGSVGDPFQPLSQEEIVLAAGGKCVVKKTFVDGKLVSLSTETPGCHTGVGNPIFNDGTELRNNTSPHGITFGNNTSTCYGPPIPSPARCVCTATPCP